MATALFVTAPLVPAIAQNPPQDIDLPADIAALLEAEPLAPVVASPDRRFVLLVHEHRLLQRARLAEPVVELAGRRMGLHSAATHAPLHYYGLTLVDLYTGHETPLPLPRDSVVGYPLWSPDAGKFAFTLTRTSGSTELWIGDAQGAYAARLVRGVKATRGAPCSWGADAGALFCEMEPPEALPRSAFAAETELLATAAGQRAASDVPLVLTSELSHRLLDAQLEIIDVRTGARRPIGAPTAFESVRPAPSGVVLLVTRVVEPYPLISGIDDTHRVTEIWNIRGEVIRRLPRDARAVQWLASQPATLASIIERDGRDRLMLHAPPFATATQAFVLPDAFSDLRFIGDRDAALVSNYDRLQQRTSLWHVGLSGPNYPARKVVEYPSNEPQAPLMTVATSGIPAAVVSDDRIYLHGTRHGAEAPVRFLDTVSLHTGERRSVWTDRALGDERLIDILSAGGERLLVSRSDAATPPNYFVAEPASNSLRALTRNENPASRLADARRVPLRYAREDGVELGATLYLPPEYDGSVPLPTVLWAYPRRVLPNQSLAPAVAPQEFPSFDRAFRLYFLLHGFAVLDDVSMPITGNDERANDTFLEQIIANSSAAIAAAEQTGFVDAARVGVAGHSYGAFMVANLLAHSQLFAAGAALSGAYNRTLTPFGFQTERRTLWEAPITYLALSPILFSHQIEAPLLLVHGLNDDNAGASPMQSTLLYSAIRGNGGNAELLLLPWEGHVYRARESVLGTAAKMLSWFDENLKPPLAPAQAALE